MGFSSSAASAKTEQTQPAISAEKTQLGPILSENAPARQLAERIKKMGIFSNPQMVKSYYKALQTMNKQIEKAQTQRLSQIPRQNAQEIEKVKQDMDRQTPAYFQEVGISDEELNKLFNEKPETAVFLLSQRLLFMNPDAMTQEQQQKVQKRLQAQFESLTGFTMEEYERLETMQTLSDGEKVLKGQQLDAPDLMLGGEVDLKANQK